MWTYHSKLTNDARELFLYTVTSTPTIFVVVKRVDEKEALTHARCAAADPHHVVQVLDRIPIPIPVPAAHPPTATDDVYLVMEHATGGTLEDLLVRTRPLRPPFPFNPDPAAPHHTLPAWFCYHVFAELLGAVLRMHTGEGIVHADLHLKNIMFQKQPPQQQEEQTPPPVVVLPNPDEIPLEEDAEVVVAAETQQQQEPWVVPAVKVIDFGRVHELPPEGDDSASQWENKPSPCLGFLATVMLMEEELYEGAGGFYAFLEDLAKSQVSIPVLREAREVAMVRRKQDGSVPQWLRDYFR